MDNVIVIIKDNQFQFEKECNNLIANGYIISSTSCCAIDRYSFSFCAILIKKETK